MFEAILERLSQDWPIFTLLSIILIKLFQSQVLTFLPDAISKHFDAQAQLKIDQQDYEQQAALNEARLKQLERMSEMSSSTFVEEQVTQFASEAQTQLVEAHSFIMQTVSTKLDIIIEEQRILIGAIRELKRNGDKSNDTKKLG